MPEGCSAAAQPCCCASECQAPPQTLPGSVQSWKRYLMRLQHFKECLEAVRRKNTGSSVLLFERSDRQTCSSPLFSSLPKQNWGVFCYVQVPLTHRTTSRYLHGSQLSRILNFILQLFISCTVCWNHSCCLLVSGCLMATMNPTSTPCHPLPVCPKWLSLCPG